MGSNEFVFILQAKHCELLNCCKQTYKWNTQIRKIKKQYNKKTYYVLNVWLIKGQVLVQRLTWLRCTRHFKIFDREPGSKLIIIDHSEMNLNIHILYTNGQIIIKSLHSNEDV